MSFQTIKEHCLQRGILYEDKEFPAKASSIYYSKDDWTIVWKRPHELVKDPKFLIEGACRFDFDQGRIGNCWYIAAAATLATRKDLLWKVVPKDQSFEPGNYAGIFHFNFWRFGKWTEVIIDDKLPCSWGLRSRLVFCRNKDECSEFWTALLEKAYAKLHGSYEALIGGWTEDAFVDFTGGIGQRLNIRTNLNTSLFHTIQHDCEMNTLMACSIKGGAHQLEAILPNGLVIRHAYSITKVAKVVVKNVTLHLIRVRNPWGAKEWKGPWSDGSAEWRSLSEAEHKRLGIINEEDGEFWMTFDDWTKHFDNLAICHLTADTIIPGKQLWHEYSYHGSWIRDVSAGGCGNSPYREEFWSNPQYTITLKQADNNSPDRHCTLIVSLIQKHARALRTLIKTSWANQYININIFKVKNEKEKPASGDKYSAKELLRVGGTGPYTSRREITYEFRLPRGTYVVIPATFYINIQMEFLLRMFTEKCTKFPMN